MTIITQKTAFYVGHIELLPRHFCFESQGCFVFGNGAQCHANKGAQNIAEHRMPHLQMHNVSHFDSKCCESHLFLL